MPQQTHPNLQLFLNRLTSRSVLSDEEQRAILGLPGHAAQAPANRDFVRLDEVVDHTCLIVDGIVGRFEQNADGLRQITSFYIPGDMPDLNSVVQPQATSALQALSTATILRVPHVALRAAARHYPAIAEALWRDATVDASILSQWVINVGRRDAQTRMAHLLCEMATRYKVVLEANEVTFEMRLTQTHLADATGLTSVHVNRTLKALRDGGLVTFANRTVTIFDWEGLIAAGEFEPSYLQTDIDPEERLRILEPS